MLQSIDLREQFKTLSIPCHIFLGQLDTLVPYKVALLAKQLNSKVTIDVVTNASHAPFISDTEQFAKRLVKALV
jgi:pimeloyl-[acyl-carrier protein] methyl ester esterase